jgi:actin-related protein 8
MRVSISTSFDMMQESLAATYGAGISSACVVDIGAVNSSIACVDEGLVIADSR